MAHWARVCILVVIVNKLVGAHVVLGHVEIGVTDRRREPLSSLLHSLTVPPTLGRSVVTVPHT